MVTNITIDKQYIHKFKHQERWDPKARDYVDEPDELDIENKATDTRVCPESCHGCKFPKQAKAIDDDTRQNGAYPWLGGAMRAASGLGWGCWECAVLELSCSLQKTTKPYILCMFISIGTFSTCIMLEQPQKV